MNNITQIVNDFGENITQVDGDIPVDLPTKDGDRFLFISYDQSFLTHGLHKYPPNFFQNYHVGSLNDILKKTTGYLIHLLEVALQMLRHFS